MQLSGEASAARYQDGMARMRSRITFTRLSPGADRGRAGSSPAERGKRTPRTRTDRAAPPAIQKSAMFTQMRAETRSVASLPFVFRFTHACHLHSPHNYGSIGITYISVIRIAVTSRASDALIKLMVYYNL